MCNNGIGLNDNETLNSIYKNVNIKLLLDYNVFKIRYL
jgi:hypothetical protein